MAQISYATGGKKAAGKNPRPTGPLVLTTSMHPDVAPDLPRRVPDPRPLPREGGMGRGALPAEFARFSGIELKLSDVVLHYTTGTTAIQKRIECRP